MSLCDAAWKDVVGFEDHFMVSSTGRVFSKRTNRELATTLLKTGYLVLNTRIGGRKGKAYSLRVHRMVAEAFLPDPGDELRSICAKQGYGVVVVRHLNGNKLDNSVENLAWGTYKDNTSDFVASPAFTDFSKSNRGTKSPLSSLSEADVRDIRESFLPRDKMFGARAFARHYGVAHSTILKVVNGKSY